MLMCNLQKSKKTFLLDGCTSAYKTQNITLQRFLSYARFNFLLMCLLLGHSNVKCRPFVKTSFVKSVTGIGRVLETLKKIQNDNVNCKLWGDIYFNLFQNKVARTWGFSALVAVLHYENYDTNNNTELCRGCHNNVWEILYCRWSHKMTFNKTFLWEKFGRTRKSFV